MKLRSTLLLLCCTLLLASCTTLKEPASTPLAELPTLAPAPVPKPKVALVLGGGAARGFAHIGVIRVLEQEKIPIDLVVGTSVGSLIGAIYAHDRSSFELEWTAFALEKDDLFDYGLLNAFTGMGAAKGEKLEAFIRNKVPTANIEDLKIPFAAVATDLNRGTRVVLDTGSVGRAVRASSAIPGVFQPVDHQGKLLVDGGVIDNVPVAVARGKGADIVIAVDIGRQVSNYNVNDIVGVMLQAITIMSAENAKVKKRDADVLIAPEIGAGGMLDFTMKKQYMQAGIEATQKMMPEIRAAIEAWERNKLAQRQ